MADTLTIETLVALFNSKDGIKDNQRVLMDARVVTTTCRMSPDDEEHTDTDFGRLNWLLSSYRGITSARYRLQSAGKCVQQFHIIGNPSIEMIANLPAINFYIAGPMNLYIMDPQNILYVPESFKR